VKGQLTQAGRLGAGRIVTVEGSTASWRDGSGERTAAVDELARAVVG
jgi:hypothetical protein